MKIAEIKKHSLIYGFESAFVIWTQGCPLHCKGCSNRDTWDIEGGFTLSVDEILSQIQAQILESNIKCVTILGGEPFMQYEELCELVYRIRGLGLAIILYSGYEIEELRSLNKDSIFSQIDVLISGRYIESMRDITLHLRGSSNQTITFFSDKYNTSMIKDGNYCEIEIDELGQISLFGYPDTFLEK